MSIGGAPPKKEIGIQKNKKTPFGLKVSVIQNITCWVKPKDQKEVERHDTANHLSVQDRNGEREIDGPRRAGIDGGVQSWDWVERFVGSISSGPREQSGF